jgi:hypothetical protein
MATHVDTPVAAETSRKRRLLHEALRWLETIGQWALATPFLLAGFAIALFLPAALAVKVTQWTFSTGSLALEIAAVTILMILTSAGLWWAFAGGRLAARLRFGRFDPFMRTATVAVFAIASFAGLTALLHIEGALEFADGPVSDETLIDKTSELYVWQLADTVPLLDITGNLEWQKPLEFESRLGGLLVVIFTGIVILPLIPALRLIAAGHREPYEHAVLKALKTEFGRRNVHETRGQHGYDRAIVARKGRILVDVMRDVRNEDAPIRRLVMLPFFEATQDVRGYVLVADAVGEQARERVESTFARQDVPSRLVVWRADQPAAHLGQAVERLADTIDSGETKPAAGSG